MDMRCKSPYQNGAYRASKVNGAVHGPPFFGMVCDTSYITYGWKLTDPTRSNK